MCILLTCDFSLKVKIIAFWPALQVHQIKIHYKWSCENGVQWFVPHISYIFVLLTLTKLKVNANKITSKIVWLWTVPITTTWTGNHVVITWQKIIFAVLLMLKYLDFQKACLRLTIPGWSSQHVTPVSWQISNKKKQYKFIIIIKTSTLQLLVKINKYILYNAPYCS